MAVNHPASVIKAAWKGKKQRTEYKKMQWAVTFLAARWKSYAARKAMARRKKAVELIRQLVRGFKARKGPPSRDNEAYFTFVRQSYLKQLARFCSVHMKVVDPTPWPKPPPCCAEASKLLLSKKRAIASRM